MRHGTNRHRASIRQQNITKKCTWALWRHRTSRWQIDAERRVGLSASCLAAFLGSSTQNMASCVGFATPIDGGLSSWVRMCHVVCHPDGHISLNIIEKINPKPKIFTETRTQDSFQVCALSSCNLLSETNKFCLGAILLMFLVLELHKTSSSGLEPRIVFSVVPFVPVISSSKQTTLILAPFFRRASIRATETIFTGNQTQDNFSGFWCLFL
jgi:hypothetical protein